ncbi:MAG: hypothetical protein HY520_00190 [Candidatus Aenigmarchaeota archaeon]|nr:hypothetical protein [Candidatus Aenigmarchaeota archaeon]
MPSPPDPSRSSFRDARAILLAFACVLVSLLVALQLLEKRHLVPCGCAADPPCAAALPVPAAERSRARESGERVLDPGHPCPPGYAVIHRTAAYLRIAPSPAAVIGRE